jgi:hypothetical protein
VGVRRVSKPLSAGQSRQYQPAAPASTNTPPPTSAPTATSTPSETPTATSTRAKTAEEPEFRDDGRGYPVADAPDVQTASEWCDALQQGEYDDQLGNATQVQFLLPDSGGADVTCVK